MVENNPGKWEVVGAKPSKTKSTKSSSSKNKKNSADQNGATNTTSKVIKVEELVSPFESQFAILDPELRAKSKRAALGLPDKPAAEKPKVKPSASKEIPKKKPSKDAGAKAEIKSLPDALKQINIKELNESLAEAKARFSGAPLIWLKNLTSYLNNHLNEEADATFSGKPQDYPSSLMPSELKKSITATFTSCNHDTLQAFYEQTLVMMPTEINRGQQICGTKLVLQQLSFYKPSLVLDNLSRLQEISRSNESRVQALLSVLWVSSQAGYKDARIGAKVWMEVMLPLINLKNYSGFVAQVATNLTPKLDGTKFKTDTISVTDYFNLSDQVTNSSIPASARKNVAAFVAALSRPMIAANSAKMFAPLLYRLAKNSDDVSRNLVECLKLDSRAFDSWQKEYKSNLLASSHLLKYCVDNEWEWAKSSQEFRTTLYHFRSINNSSVKQSNVMGSCQKLIDSFVGNGQRKKKSSLTLKNINYLLLISLVSLVFYDVRINGKGEFTESRIGQVFERYGVNANAAHMYQQYEPYIIQAREKSQPAVDFASIYLNLLKEKSQPIVDTASFYINVLNEKSQPLIESAIAHAIRVKDIFSEKSKPIIENMLVYANQLKNTVQQKGEELFPGISVEAEKKYNDLLVLITELSTRAAETATVYSSLAIENTKIYSSLITEKVTVYSSLATEQAVDYSKKAADYGNVYTQRIRQTIMQVVEEERVQQALKYTYEMYNKALHYVGICTH